MSHTKLHKVIKKYRKLHEKHEKSWENKCEQVRKRHVDNKDPNVFFTVSRLDHEKHAVKGNRLFNSFIAELEGLEVFPKKKK